MGFGRFHLESMLSGRYCTVGIPAYNEENTLPLLLHDLYHQMQSFENQLQIIVVANGCTDRTAQVAVEFGRNFWGNPYIVSVAGQQWWNFQTFGHVYQVCETHIARKSYALNIIHNNALAEIILLFDSDVRLGNNVVQVMFNTLKESPQYGTVAVRYIGEIAPISSRVSPLEWFRVGLSSAINHFDHHLPRLDGKGFGYRRELIDEHPSLIAVDMWLEGHTWEKTAGCNYLDEVHIRYYFPATFNELTNQYARYVKSIKVLAAKYPQLVSALKHGRSISRNPLKPYPSWHQRLIGWLFYRWIDVYLLIYGNNEEAVEKWQVMKSTKRLDSLPKQ